MWHSLPFLRWLYNESYPQEPPLGVKTVLNQREMLSELDLMSGAQQWASLCWRGNYWEPEPIHLELWQNSRRLLQGSKATVHGGRWVCHRSDSPDFIHYYSKISTFLLNRRLPDNNCENSGSRSCFDKHLAAPSISVPLGQESTFNTLRAQACLSQQTPGNAKLTEKV